MSVEAGRIEEWTILCVFIDSNDTKLLMDSSEKR